MFKKKFGFLSSNFMKLCRNILCSVWQILGGLKKFKMAAIAMVPTPLFWYLGFHGNAILNFINTPKASTHYSEYSYNAS
jgi:cellobiose-specific phosphotransferase system component IIC